MFEIVLLISVVSVISVVFKIRKQYKHLTESELDRVRKNALRPNRDDHITAHLGVCEQCRNQLTKN